MAHPADFQVSSNATQPVRRISQQCGEKLLKLRASDLIQWRAGTLASTDELAGKRDSVQIDGGRTKLRGPLRKSAAPQETRNADGLIISDAPGRSKPRPKQTFDGEWRERPASRGGGSEL